ncbi:cysteine--1-D-myo-inosityl 2-amino-2-deoxy-alpha-D-glucopyranoside ligase [Longispora albida]|uniref:cysteine--1-D-myo-inosityl 2-amino-2-deoxy-alpha-D-glucopyranoside ligase n=1 Tax=Longispora albida TaxID=203523 RepID=UPI0003703825|nr:cysteine--1-D-myo-inosityl 2-amino-2-deoxy-alpha-D-glucopyranoside ligase [Longispora albida]
MDSWLAPELPTLPGKGLKLSLFDSSSGQVRPTEPSGAAKMYVCGITPYDAAHLGHAATMITFDLINRLWRDAGHDVNYVSNVTDIDDPLLERATRDGQDWIVLGMLETALFREDMEALRILPPDHYVGAVESIPAIVTEIERLVASGAAYRLEDGTGDVYFDVTAAPAFGYESRLDRAAMLGFFAERGGDPERAGKRDALDPLLWRGVRAGEPSWDGRSLGDGRPGWHIECAVIALSLLGDRIDVQGGGNDLLFPHHEMSAAHAECLTGTHPFATHYTHAGMIGLDGEKMSKSKGNLVFVSKLRGIGVDPMAIRLALLADHYRTDRQWTDTVGKAGEDRLDRWRSAVARRSGAPAEPLVQALRELLTSDLDTTGALAAVDAWAEADGTDESAPALVAAAVDALLGVKL